MIHQSVTLPPLPALEEDDPDAFRAVLLAHLRPVKDPLLAAAAARRLPGTSRLVVEHLGGPGDDDLNAAAREAAAATSRYRWLGERSRPEALARLARAEALLVTSRLEGGANVVSEAIALGVPVLSTRIAGSEGLLGRDYPAYFPPGDAAALAALLERLEGDPGLRADLRGRIAALRPLVDPARERAAWADLLAELGG